MYGTQMVHTVLHSCMCVVCINVFMCIWMCSVCCVCSVCVMCTVFVACVRVCV